MDITAPSGDAERDARMKRRLEEEIEKLKRNQDRRLQRKNAKAKQVGEKVLTLDRPMKAETTVSLWRSLLKSALNLLRSDVADIVVRSVI